MEIDMRILAIVLFAGIVFVCVLLILLISTVHICDVSRGKKRRRMPDTREIVFDVDEDEAEDNAEDDETESIETEDVEAEGIEVEEIEVEEIEAEYMEADDMDSEDTDTGNGDLLLESESEIEQKEEGELPVIEVRNVTMKFKVSTSSTSGLKDYMIQRIKKQLTTRDLLALDNVSFEVYKGEVVGIIGTNGSGKSTLLKIVSGALEPTSGQVKVDKRKIQLLTLGAGFD